jgi:hypothetical protein
MQLQLHAALSLSVLLLLSPGIMLLFLPLSLILVREINNRIAQFLWLLITDTVIMIM